MSQANEQENSFLLLEDTSTDEFAYDTVLTKLTELHSDDEVQRGSLLESMQRLQKYHVIQIYKLGLRPLLISMSDTTDFRVQAQTLFDLCSSFCYTQDVSERIAFDNFSKALQFCFPTQPVKCLSSAVVSNLLELFRTLKKENIVSYSIEQSVQQPNTQLLCRRRGSEYFIGALLEIFQGRRDRVDECITDVIDQTKRIALLDAQEHRTENLESNAVFLTSWIKLLEITEVSNYFASCLAKDSCLYFNPLSQVRTTAQKFEIVLSEIKRTEGEIHLPTDKERIDLLLKYITHFCQYQDRNVILSSLRLLADLKIDRDVLEVVFEKFLFKGKEEDYQYLRTFENRALDLLSDVLPLFPKEIVFKIIQVCEKFFSRNRDDYALCDPTLCELSAIPINTLSPYYCTLCEVLSLFVYDLHIESHCIPQNRAETILKLFSALESRRNVKFLVAVIKQLSLCPSAKLTLEFKKFVLCELDDLAKHFRGDKERDVFQKILEILSSSQVYECTQELLSEILSYLKRFFDKDRPMKTIEHPVLTLLSLLSTVPISDDRRLKVLKRAKASRKGLFSSTLMLELMTTFFRLEEANVFFDHVHSVFVDEFKEDKDLFESFQKVIHKALSSTSFQIVPKVGILEVARSISTGIFNEEVDSCCLIVLSWALGMSDSEMVELFSEVQRCANEIFHDQNGSDSKPYGQYNIFWAFALSLHHVVSSVEFSGEEKLILVEKVCNIFLKGLDVMTPWQIMDAVKNLIPYAPWQNEPDSTGSEEKMSLSFNHIVTFLEDSKMMVQLGRIPDNMDRSLYSVLSEINPNSFTRDRLADVYNFIRSQEHLDEGFFHRILSFLEVGIQTLNSGEDVLEVLQEMEHFLRAIIPDLIPLVMLSYEYLIQNQVLTKERKVFMGDVIMKWQSSTKAVVLSFLKLPQLLWKAFAGTDCFARRCETVQRMQEILKGANKEVENYCYEKTGHGYDNLSEISFKELEWLIFDSSLPNHDAALAFSLIFRFRNKQLNYLSSFCGKRENVFLQFLSDGTACIQEVSSQDNMSTLCGARVESEGSHTRAAKARSRSALTPVSIAQKMIQILRRIRMTGEDVSEICFSLWDSVFSCCSMGVTTCLDHQCQITLSSFCRDDYLDLLLSVLEESSSTEVFLFWVKKNWHHLHQCSDIILKSCRKTAAVSRLDEEARLKFHTAIFNTLEMMRTRTTSPSQLAPFQLGNNCFRSLETQLRYLSKVLDINWPIEVTLAVLSSSQEEAIKLVEGVQGIFEENREHPEIILTAAFALQLSQAHGRLCADSSKDLLLKINEHIERLRDDDPEDVSGLIVLPKWRQMMIAEGFSVKVIDSWCVAFLTTPLKELSSRDIDAIAGLNSRSLQLVSSVSKKIKECVFPETGFGVKEGVNESHIRERLRLARLLGEFINVLKQRKPDENHKDALIRDIVVEACDDLCNVYQNPSRKRKELYKIRERMLKALFTEVFGKQQNQVNEPEFAVDSAVEDQSCKEVQRKASPVKKQASYLHENLPRLVENAAVNGPLSVLLRRWLSTFGAKPATIAAKPVLAFHTRNVIQEMFSAYTSEKDPTLMELHHITLKYTTSLERNQALISQLQVAGYNQKLQNTLDLWSSPSIECPGYLSNKESANRQRLVKKLTKILRCLWNEWKEILQMSLQMDLIGPVKVGEKVIPTEELFSLQASLEDMDKQASAVRPIMRQIASQIPSLEGRVKVLMSQEQRHRARIKKLESEVRNLKYKITLCQRRFKFPVRIESAPKISLTIVRGQTRNHTARVIWVCTCVRRRPNQRVGVSLLLNKY